MKNVNAIFLKAVADEFGEEFLVDSIEEKGDRICITLKKEKRTECNSGSGEPRKEEKHNIYEDELSFF